MKAILDEFNKIKFTNEGDLRLPCGKCTECISKRALEWATRVKHEMSYHDENTFITLTYSDENYPNPFDFKKNFKVFMDKLRKHLKRKIMYIVSHEYGTKTGRPHHHAIIFGWEPSNQKFLKTTPKGESLFTSSELEKIWTKGHSSIGTANEKTAYYIASYSLKSSTFQIHDPNTGELHNFKDSMDCSKRPAIGSRYITENAEQLSQNGDILPRYYIKRLKEENPTLHEYYENERTLKLKTRGTYEVLAKYVIDQQKILLTSEFRSTTENTKEHEHKLSQYKHERDEVHRHQQKETK